MNVELGSISANGAERPLVIALDIGSSIGRRAAIEDELSGRRPLGTVWSDAGAWTPHASNPSTELANTIES